jgi:hypothetical protein
VRFAQQSAFLPITRQSRRRFLHERHRCRSENKSPCEDDHLNRCRMASSPRRPASDRRCCPSTRHKNLGVVLRIYDPQVFMRDMERMRIQECRVKSGHSGYQPSRWQVYRRLVSDHKGRDVRGRSAPTIKTRRPRRRLTLFAIDCVVYTIAISERKHPILPKRLPRCLSVKLI